MVPGTFRMLLRGILSCSGDTTTRYRVEPYPNASLTSRLIAMRWSAVETEDWRGVCVAMRVAESALTLKSYVTVTGSGT